MKPTKPNVPPYDNAAFLEAALRALVESAEGVKNPSAALTLALLTATQVLEWVKK